MLDQILDSGYMKVARQALTGLSRRHEAIASNIANIDTPGYQRKEVSFEDALKKQVAGEQTQPQMAVTDPRHIQNSAAGSDLSSSMRARNVVASRNDNNSVDIDEEMTNLVDTQLRYQALSQSIGQRLNTLRTAIRGN
jgi:flagellar basal-body rod protein FlgB